MAQITLDISELPTREEELVRCFTRPGDRIVVTRCGNPIFELTPHGGIDSQRHTPAATTQRKLGLTSGTTTMAPDFNDPLPPEVWTDMPK